MQTVPKWRAVDLEIGRAFVRAGGHLRRIDINSNAFDAAVQAFKKEHVRLTGRLPDSTSDELTVEVLDTLQHEVTINDLRC